MIIIVEPKKYIVNLWSKPEIKKNECLRLMRYVLRVDHEDRVILHNAVTNQLVVLNQNEAQILNCLPMRYNEKMESLINNHFLVPVDYDEHQQVQNIRHILRLMETGHKKKAVTKYTILPTTACNARCYYCFEQGVKYTSMTEETAEQVVEFIANHCGENKSVRITWFGGEPTLGEKRIDQISRGLRERGIQYSSDMTTNGYLFDEEMVRKAKELWNLRYLQICFDGLEHNHNRIKCYVGAKDNPYQRTLRNIGLLLDQGIRVGMRMNFDVENHQDFEGLIREVRLRFPNQTNLSVYAYPVLGEHKDKAGIVHHGGAEWFEKKIAELNGSARNQGVYNSNRALPYLKYHCCDAENDSTLTILPQGTLTRCCQCLDDEQSVGNLQEGINNALQYSSWNEYSDYGKCRECVYFPNCVRINRCPAKDRCLFYYEWRSKDEMTIKNLFNHNSELVEGEPIC